MYLLIKAGAIIYLTGSLGRPEGEVMVMELSRQQSNFISLLLVCLFLLRMFYLFIVVPDLLNGRVSQSNANSK